jgi:hypothetical protein
MRTRKEIETRLKQEEKIIKKLLRQSYHAGYDKGVMEETEESGNANGWLEALTWILETKKRSSL